MANPKDIISKGISMSEESVVRELVSRVFSTRGALHLKHLASKSYAEHVALGDLYEEIVGKVDDIVECYQGKYGIMNGLTVAAAAVPADVVAHIKEEQAFVARGRGAFTGDCEAIGAIMDELDAMYLKTIYKLENLK